MSFRMLPILSILLVMCLCTSWANGAHVECDGYGSTYHEATVNEAVLAVAQRTRRHIREAKNLIRQAKDDADAAFKKFDTMKQAFDGLSEEEWGRLGDSIFYNYREAEQANSDIRHYLSSSAEEKLSLDEEKLTEIHAETDQDYCHVMDISRRVKPVRRGARYIIRETDELAQLSDTLLAKTRQAAQDN